MSRHLIIRCDALGCEAQTITRASDTEPTSIATPGDWLTLIMPGRAHRHYCSEACLRADASAPAPAVIAEPASPASTATRANTRKAVKP